MHRQGGRVLYRKITRKLSETSRKISRKFSSKKVCTASDARASTFKPISRTTARQSHKIPKYSDDPDKTALKQMLQRRRKLTESRQPLVDRSDVKPNGDDLAVITLDSCNSLKNNNGLASSGPDSPDSKKYTRPLLGSTSIINSSTSGHTLGQNKHPVMRPSCWAPFTLAKYLW